MESLVVWLQGLGLERYASVLAENEVDFEALRLLSEQDLQELGLPLGPRKKLLKAIADLDGAEKPGLESGFRAAEPKPSPQPSTEGERRQLTVLFCDMVGFTELANRLDPEVLRSIIRGYEDACAVCVTRYEGYVFQRLGDGIVAFFGYPLAHEGEAERAIRAGLQIMDALSQLDIAEVGHLQVRIGIATGVVVVSSAEKGAVGETMNLASRLQGIAPVGSIVVSERVHRLAGGSFDYEDMGEQTLKGISRPTHAFRILGVSAAASRFEAATHEGLTPLVGREPEIGHLAQCWHMARKGEGQVVLLSGEPGIGKSRILSALRERLENQVAGALRFQCSPYYVNSAFYPNIDNFERALKFGRDEPAGSKLDKLEALVVGQFARPLADARFIASILSIPTDERYGPLAMTPQKQKDETIRVLVDLTEAAARREPSLMLFEDAHWADPTTLEVLDLLIDRVRHVPLLIVITHRPEFQSRWSGREHVTTLNLSKLTRAQSSAMVHELAGGKALPAELLEQIIAKTDGVPLFVEELTKSILESTMLLDAGDHYAYSGSASAVTIPATLRDSLMARLDRFMPVKEIAQIGAAIGREFSHELIAAVAQMSKEDLDDGLRRLTESGLAFQQGLVPDAVYTFKHALVQDAAYDSLLKTRRQELHGKIAWVIEEQFPATKDTEPELLAHHHTAAGNTEQAIGYWRKAGELALQRMVLNEAIAHLDKGLALVPMLSASTSRDLMELELRTILGSAWMALGGWFHGKVYEHFEPAWSIATAVERADVMAPIMWGLAMHVLCQGRSKESLQWVNAGFAATEKLRHEDIEIVADMMAVVCLFWHGDLIAAKAHVDSVLERYKLDSHRRIAEITNHDPKTLVLIYQVNLLWALGFPDQASLATEELDTQAVTRGHYFDQGFAWTLGAWANFYCGEAQKQGQFLDKAYRVGIQHGLPFFPHVLVPFHRGYHFSLLGRYTECIEAFSQGCDNWKSLGGGVALPHALACWAEAEGHAGRPETGLRVISEALAQIRRPGWEERCHMAEVLRVHGWLCHRIGELSRAEESYRASIAWAQEQQAKGWELRTAISYARLMREERRKKEARELLKPIYDWFTEGFDTKDLKEAKALLDELGETHAKA